MFNNILVSLMVVLTIPKIPIQEDIDQRNTLICIMFQEQEMLLQVINLIHAKSWYDPSALDQEVTTIIPTRDEELLIEVLSGCD